MQWISISNAMICSLMCIAMAGQVITTDVSWYSKAETCPNRECITASGVKPYVGSVACSRRLKLGSLMIIDGKVYKCEDRLSPRFDNRVDIWTESYDEAIKNGVQKKTIIIN